MNTHKTLTFTISVKLYNYNTNEKNWVPATEYTTRILRRYIWENIEIGEVSTFGVRIHRNGTLTVSGSYTVPTHFREDFLYKDFIRQLGEPTQIGWSSPGVPLFVAPAI